MSLTLGLDIGIASVGWGLINTETQEIVDGAVRLFSVGTAEENQNRRSKRSARRGKQRRQQRLKELTTLFHRYGLPETPQTLENPYELRVKGLTEALTAEQLSTALYHLLKHRGISYLEGQSLELLEVEGDEYAAQLASNLKALKQSYPCEIQWERYQTYGQCRGLFEVTLPTGETQWLLNTFPNQAYLKEAQALLKMQRQYHPVLDDDFESTYFNLLERKRPFYVGPGNEKSRTDYGIYRTNGETLSHLYADSIGMCSIFPEERRLSAFSKKAQLYNWLNDLNNLTIGGEKLTTEDKQHLLTDMMTQKKVSSGFSLLKRLAKLKGVPFEEIQGYRRDNKGNPDCHCLEPYLRLKQALGKIESACSLESLSETEIERLAYLMTLNSDPIALTEVLQAESFIPSEWITPLVVFRTKNGKFFSKWHAYSEKALDLLIPHLWKTANNQMQVLKQLNLIQPAKFETVKGKYLPIPALTEDLFNPVVRRAVQESGKIINEILKRYGTLDYIVVEMARDWNGVEDKKAIQKQQEAAAAQTREAFTEASVEYPFWHQYLEQDPLLKLKVQLWHEQEKCCVYSGERITISALIHAPHLFEVDHIIPKSISFDDSRQNKVLCLAQENQSKGQRSPYDYFMETQSKEAYQRFKQRVLALYADGKGLLTRTKKELLLCEDSLSKYDTRLKFKHRNLNDTRYATRLVFNTLQDFMKAKHYPTKVVAVRGKFTSQLRRHWGLTKNRQETYSHHLTDALVVASVPHLALFQATSLLADDQMIQPPLTSQEYNEKVFSLPYPTYLAQIEQATRQCRYSYKVDTKGNRKLSDETIYSTRKGFKKNKETKCFELDPTASTTYIVEKYKNIYSKEESIKVYTRLKEQPTSFLMWHYHPQVFNQLLEALAPYENEKNPIMAYYQANGPLQSVDRKGVATPIRQLKYFGDQLNQGIRIQSHYPTDKEIVLCTTNPWRTDIFYNRRTGNYQGVGIRYYKAKFQKGGSYGISLKDYQSVLAEQKQKIELTEAQIQSLLETGEAGDYVFCFSLYKNQCFEYQFKDDDQITMSRHWSFDISNNNLSQKRIETPEANQKPLPRLTLRKCQQLTKVHVDVLGYPHRIYREPLTLEMNI